MSDVITRVYNPLPTPTSDWQEAVRRINEACSLSVKDVCAVIGNPVEGIVVPARLEAESVYRNAIGA